MTLKWLLQSGSKIKFTILYAIQIFRITSNTVKMSHTPFLIIHLTNFLTSIHLSFIDLLFKTTIIMFLQHAERQGPAVSVIPVFKPSKPSYKSLFVFSHFLLYLYTLNSFVRTTFLRESYLVINYADILATSLEVDIFLS